MMNSLLKITITVLTICLLSGCLVLPLKQSDEDRSLYWCPPLLNCVSTEAVTPVHHIKPFVLAVSFDKAWPVIKDSVSKLDRTSIKVEYDGYLYAKSHSPVMEFVDYLEVLYIAKSHSLNVRSSSLLGIWDVGINKNRTELLRKLLIKNGIVKDNE
jgi:uncharacterized protein (DUF1499 family)